MTERQTVERQAVVTGTVDPLTGEIMVGSNAGREQTDRPSRADVAETLRSSSDPMVRDMLANHRLDNLLADDADQAEVAAQAIVARILDSAADGPEAILTPSAPLGLKTAVGQVITLRAVQWLPSQFEKGPRLFAVIAAKAPDGADVLYTTGARNVMAQVYALDHGGHLPREVLVYEATQTSRGFKPMWLLNPPGVGGQGHPAGPIPSSTPATSAQGKGRRSR